MIRLVALAFVAGLVVSACAGAPAAGPGSSAPAAASATPALVKLTASYSNVIASNLPVWVAKEAGIFSKNGLDVDLALIESTKGIAALLSGDTKVAHIGGSEVLSAAAGGADLVIVGGTVPVWPYVLLVAPEIQKPGDLKGKKLAIAGVGGSYDIAARVLLPRLGLKPDEDVFLFAAGSVANATAALLSGQVQATLSQPPDQLALEPKGFHVLANMADLHLPTANTTIAMTRAYVTANKDVTQRYVDSIVEAIAKQKKDRPFTIDVLKKYLKTTDEKALNATYDHYVVTVIPSAPFVRAEQFADAIATLGKLNPKVASFDVKKILDESFVQSAIDRGIDKR
ncbi:MAG TPA: ABC transporter substrate-binding protein [Candidatus Limnocylindria bacterium]